MRRERGLLSVRGLLSLGSAVRNAWTRFEMSGGAFGERTGISEDVW
jgi:hypothetical protein